MNVRVFRIISLAAACALFAPAAALAQQTQPNPPGITVVTTGTATVTDWVERIDLRFSPPADGGAAYAACASAIERLGAALKDAGLPATAVVSSAVEYTGMAGGNPAPVAWARIQVAPAEFAKLSAAVEKAGWKTSGTVVLQPRDADAAAIAAYRAAFASARTRAEAIAAADGRHAGKLINVQPTVADYLTGMMTSLATMAAQLGRATAEAPPSVSETASFTFEITP